MQDHAMLPTWTLHRCILAAIGELVAALVLVAIVGGSRVGVAGSVIAVLAYGVHVALSTVLASFANTRRGVVLAHVASPAVIVGLLWVL